MANDDLPKLRIDKTRITFRPSRFRRGVVSLSIVAVLALLGFFYSRGWLTPALSVQIATVSQIYPSQTLTVLNASGYVVAQRKSSLASKVTGRLVWLGVEEGMVVKAGQVVARLENEDVQAAKDRAEAQVKAARFNLEQAKAELREATLNFERYRALLAKQVIAPSAYDSALARYERAAAAVEVAEATLRADLAALEGAKINLDYTLIRAPFDAVVLTKNADIGDIVTPIGAAANAKSAVITIADMNSLQVEADVSESNLNRIQQGQPCEILLDAIPGHRFPGVIHMIVPTADRTKATVMVKVRFTEKDPRILPEMSAKVAFLSRAPNPEEQTPRVVIPPDAVVRGKEGTRVFLIRGERAYETPIRLGKPLGEMVEILEGVKAGDQIVSNPPKGLKNGSRIKAAER